MTVDASSPVTPVAEHSPVIDGTDQVTDVANAAHTKEQRKQQRLLALAAVFQAAQFAHRLALQGKAGIQPFWDEYETLLRQSLAGANNPSTPREPLLVSQLTIGLKVLENCLREPWQQESASPPLPLPFKGRLPPALKYSLSLMVIERRLDSSPKLRAAQEDSLLKLQDRLAFFDQDISHPSIIAGFAQSYLASAGKLRFRLNIRGQQQHLKRPATVDQIRAILLAGTYFAKRWHDLGGRRWQLLFQRKQLLRDLERLTQS